MGWLWRLPDIYGLLAVESQEVPAEGRGEPVLANLSLKLSQIPPAEVVVEKLVLQCFVDSVARLRLYH